MALIKKTTGGERWETVEISILHRDGSVRTVLWNSATVFAADGRTPVATIAQGQDITERKQAELALRDSEERFRATFEQAAVGIAQVGLDGRWLRVNQRLCEIVGYERAELLQCTFQDVTHPEDLNIDLAFVRQVLAGEIQNYSMVKRYIRKDRSLVWVNLTVGLVRTEAGAPKYFVSVVEDITERKQVEVALRESEKRFRSLAVATSQIIWYTDAQGKVCGPMPSFQAYTGQSDEEILGSGWAATLHPDDVARTIKVWQEAVAAQTGYLTEYRLRRRDGVYRHFTARGAPVVADDGSILEWIGTCSDITERKQAEETLHESEAKYRTLI